MIHAKFTSIKRFFIIILFLIANPGCSMTPTYTRDTIMMDTFVHFTVKGNLNNKLKKRAVDKAIERMEELEKRCNYFSKESELTRLNSLKSGEHISLSGELQEIIQKADKFRKLTNGVFDVRVGQNNTIDLGGIAKGFIVDEGIKVFKEEGIDDALISAGGDMYCMGEYKIGIRDPKDRRRIIATFKVNNKGVATSGGYERPFHIIDPRIGKPVKNVLRSVTVVAGDCTTADALATALYVLGPQEGLSLIEKIDGVECVIVDEDGTFYISQNFTKLYQLNKLER